MKIAYLLGTFPSTRETFVSNEVIDLVRRGVDVEVFSWSMPTGEVMHPEVRASGILERVSYFRWRHLPRVIGKWAFWRALGQVVAGSYRRTFRTPRDKFEAAYFAALLAVGQFQHCHVHFLSIGKHLAGLAGLPYSFTAHCYGDDAMSAEVKAAYGRELQRVPLAVAASEFVQRGMRSLVPGEHHTKIRLVRCGIDAETFSPERTELDYDVLCVAGFGESKGLEYLIRATALLKARRPELRVALVGGPPARQPEMATALREECSICGAEDAFVFLGPRPSDEVRDLMRRSRVFALPCVVTREGQMDGLPVALMEAAACGLPLVSTAVAGIPELVIDGVTGFIVPQRNPEALADAMERLLEDAGMRERMGRAARELVEKEFSREVSGQRMLEAFASIPLA